MVKSKKVDAKVKASNKNVKKTEKSAVSEGAEAERDLSSKSRKDLLLLMAGETMKHSTSDVVHKEGDDNVYVPVPMPLSISALLDMPPAITTAATGIGQRMRAARLAQNHAYTEMDLEDENDQEYKAKPYVKVEAKYTTGLSNKQVKHLMKTNKDVGRIKEDALVAMAHATEGFLGYLWGDADLCMRRDKKKKLRPEHIAQAIEFNEQLSFLTDTFGPVNPTGPDESQEMPPQRSYGTEVAPSLPSSFSSSSFSGNAAVPDATGTAGAAYSSSSSSPAPSST